LLLSATAASAATFVSRTDTAYIIKPVNTTVQKTLPSMQVDAVKIVPDADPDTDGGADEDNTYEKSYADKTDYAKYSVTTSSSKAGITVKTNATTQKPAFEKDDSKLAADISATGGLDISELKVIVGPLGYVISNNKIVVIDTSKNEVFTKLDLGDYRLQYLALNKEGTLIYVLGDIEKHDMPAKYYDQYLLSIDTSTNELAN